jgi:hypothetical protein
MLDTGYHTVYTDNSADLPVPYEAIICKCCWKDGARFSFLQHPVPSILSWLLHIYKV